MVINTGELDKDVRHFIYTSFLEHALPPTTEMAAQQRGISIAQAEQSFERLAGAHQIALAPGSHSIWMAHPFSGLPTNYTTRIGDKTYWAN